MVNLNRILGAGLTSLDARQKLVSRLKNKGIRNKIILEIIKNIPRHLFIETALRDRAYNDVALPIGYNQTISQPYIVGKMTQLIFENDNMKKILEIGTGCGYQTAILSHLCSQVYTIEIQNELLSKAKKRISKLNLKNVSFKSGNGVKGWEDKVLFDAIIISAACEAIPIELLKSLKNPKTDK